MSQETDAISETVRQEDRSSNEPSDFEVDGSSSLSEIEENCIREVEEESFNNGEGLEEFAIATYDNTRNISDAENLSEAETVCLEESLTKICCQSDASFRLIETLASDEIFSRQKDNLIPDESEKKTLNSPASHKKTTEENEIVIEESKTDIRKRKLSVMKDTEHQDLNEPVHKRPGSILDHSDSSHAEDEVISEDNTSNTNTKNSCVEGVTQQEDESSEDIEEFLEKEELNPDHITLQNCHRIRSSEQKKSISPKPTRQDDDSANSVDQHTETFEVDSKIQVVVAPNNEEEEEEEGAENISRNEEAKKKRIALDRLGDIEQQFSTFRERLYEERLKSLNHEDAMLREAQPSHPEYLAKLQCIDARRDEKIRKAIRLREYEMQSLKKVAVAQRSQILVQYQQEVREVREKKLEKLGEQWYKIQHDRRSYAGICPEYTLKFPTKRTQQVSNHIAYNNEVSVLSGIAKYVGFPAAPNISPASASELEDDLEKMGACPNVTTKRSFSVT